MKFREPDFSPEWLASVLSYDEDSGLFTWLVNRGRAVAGSVAGSVDPSGHIQICIARRLYLAHRLAWYIKKGVWPEHEIDHRNGVRNDNRWANIRAATRHQNQHNRSLGKNNRSGFLGVHFSDGKWIAQITSDGVQTRLGSFSSPELAYEAYLAAKRDRHPFQPAPRYEAANDNQSQRRAA